MANKRGSVAQRYTEKAIALQNGEPFTVNDLQNTMKTFTNRQPPTNRISSIVNALVKRGEVVDCGFGVRRSHREMLDAAFVTQGGGSKSKVFVAADSPHLKEE